MKDIIKNRRFLTVAMEPKTHNSDTLWKNYNMQN